jgi:hypothetical protein
LDTGLDSRSFWGYIYNGGTKMKIIVKLTQEEKEKLVREAFENFPEASAGSALVCVGWKYDDFIFKFEDQETGNKYTVTLPDAVRGLNRLLKVLEAGGLPGLGLTLSTITDTGTWDALGFDALAQMATLGAVIYG